MSRIHRSRRFLLLPLAVAGGLLASGCDPTPAPPARPVRFKAPPPAPPRRTEHPETDTAKWLAAWRDTRSRIDELQAELEEARKFQTQNQLDHFLYLDPESLSADQLCQLFHFLERGYFTVERQLVTNLLERRLSRTSAAPAIPDKPRGQSSYKERIAAAMQRDELRIVDIEGAIRAYQEPGDEAFRIPQSLSAEELTELRETVTQMLDETRARVTRMDRQIAVLKAKVFNLPEPAEEDTPDKTIPFPEKSSNTDRITDSEPETLIDPEMETGNPAAIPEPAEPTEDSAADSPESPEPPDELPVP